MHLAAALGLLATVLPTSLMADIGGRVLPCDQVTAAPACQRAAELWGFVPSGGIAVLADRLRLAGVESLPGDDRAVILDLALPGGEVLAVVPLPPSVPLTAVTELSPDGAVLLVVDPVAEPELDAIAPQTLLVFDATGQQIGAAEGLAVSAMADAFGENRLGFAPGRVTLDLAPLGVAGAVSVRYDSGKVEGGALIPDGMWLYDALFDRDRSWQHDDATVVATYARDGSPSTVILQGAEADRTLIASGSPGSASAYGVEFFGPVLSPDAARLAVLQLGEAAPGPILVALDMASGGEIWRGSVAWHKARWPVYRWTPDGALVILQPHPVLPDLSVLTLFSPAP
ncbi:hypothetical protein EI545_19855 [Tabrizicola piscis]|uniref:Phytase-like domain-containing protein n=1 Tax=Tabrizicola piscis TaxID=2494374 RepID=A0A3S8UB88_9RHOB|nr:hypothetical protein [Tabrizicola piscis]AZL60874.1 hypothetical protein EI545_19855 [Tabrizicola piscis]